MVVDAQGKVVMINPAAEKLLGVSRQDKVGKSLTEDMKDEERMVWKAIERVNDPGPPPMKNDYAPQGGGGYLIESNRHKA